MARQIYLCSDESTNNNRKSGVFYEAAPRLYMYNEDFPQLELDEVKGTLRLAVYRQSVGLGVKHL
jgi:hypothetical protein